MFQFRQRIIDCREKCHEDEVVAPDRADERSINTGSHDASLHLQWNERFNVELVHPGNIVILTRENLQRTATWARKVRRKGNPNG